MSELYYGDNLDILRECVPDASVDLVYLDPPFNSNATYNILFKAQSGSGTDASIEAFDDTWQWGPAAAQALFEITRSGNHTLHALMQAMRTALGDNALMAYLAMMAVRLIELHRVLKPTGSLYLHCDPTASHYLKLVLDAVFGPAGFRNEIVWQRLSGAKADARQYGRNSDRLLFYTVSATYTFNPPRSKEHNEKTLKDWYTKSDARGRYVSRPLTAAGGTGGDSGQPWRDRKPTGHWTVPIILQKRYEAEKGVALVGSVRAKLETLADAGFIDFSANGLPSWRRYLDEAEPPRIHDIWSDDEVKSISRNSDERLGYPTQKPRALLERVIEASSLPGNTVLDPFCGCGTAVDAAQRLGRRWIGIDITHLAIGLIEKRLREGYGDDLEFEIVGVPKDRDSALRLAAEKPHEFQNWFCLKIGGYPLDGGRKGADRGIDGHFYPYEKGEQPSTGVISVKAGRNIGVEMVRDLRGVMERDGHPYGLFLCAWEPTRAMKAEAASAGVHLTQFGAYPRMQILTPDDLFHGRFPQLPPLAPINRRVGRVDMRPSHQTGAQGNLM